MDTQERIPKTPHHHYRSVMTKLPREMRDSYKIWCKENGSSMSQMSRRLIEKKMEEEGLLTP